jgi:hypothetical protein
MFLTIPLINIVFGIVMLVIGNFICLSIIWIIFKIVIWLTKYKW